MKITQVQIYEYRLPLRRSLTLKGVSMSDRRGVLVRFGDSSGHIGWGDVAPLPGFSVESPNDAQQQIIAFAPDLIGREIPDAVVRLDDAFSFWLDNDSLHPSVRFGLETSILGLLARSREIGLAELLNPSCRNTISVNGLISGDETDIVGRAKQLRDSGYRVVKLKVGMNELETDVARVRAVRQILGDHVEVRLDANRAWSFDEASRFARRIADCHVEYVEEPLADASRLAQLARETGMPIALDESVCSLVPDTVPSYTGLKAIVLKPTLLGGFEQVMKFARAAISIGLVPVVSSSFESSIGLKALANLAASLPNDTPCGLDTLDWFAQDVLEVPLQATNGRIRVLSFDEKSTRLNHDVLTEVFRA